MADEHPAADALRWAGFAPEHNRETPILRYDGLHEYAQRNGLDYNELCRVVRSAYGVNASDGGKTRMSNITSEVLAELERAMRKFPTWPTDPLHALAVLGEEFGELTKDVLQLTYEPHKTSAENVRTEAIQTAAMALRFAASLSRYSYLPADQHAQEPAAFGVLGTHESKENDRG